MRRRLLAIGLRDLAKRRPPPARPLGQMAFGRLRPPHLVRAQLDRQPIDQPRHSQLAPTAPRPARPAPRPAARHQLASSAKPSKPKPGSSAAALSASSRCRCAGSRLGDGGRDRRRRRPAVDPEADERHRRAPSRRCCQLAGRGRDQPLQRLARRFGMRRPARPAGHGARRRLGRGGGQRLGLAARASGRAHRADCPPRGTAAPATAAAIPASAPMVLRPSRSRICVGSGEAGAKRPTGRVAPASRAASSLPQHGSSALLP